MELIKHKWGDHVYSRERLSNGFDIKVYIADRLYERFFHESEHTPPDWWVDGMTVVDMLESNSIPDKDKCLIMLHFPAFNDLETSMDAWRIFADRIAYMTRLKNGVKVINIILDDELQSILRGIYETPPMINIERSEIKQRMYLFSHWWNGKIKTQYLGRYKDRLYAHQTTDHKNPDIIRHYRCILIKEIADFSSCMNSEEEYIMMHGVYFSMIEIFNCLRKYPIPELTPFVPSNEEYYHSVVKFAKEAISYATT